MRISRREKALLGYTTGRPQGSFQTLDSSSPRTSNRSSDIDLSDVFGGPPRRSSLQDVQRRFYDVEEDRENPWRKDENVNGDDEALMGRSSWPGYPGGTPVFGTDISGRRRHAAEDFYVDIFGGDQSLSSSPRMSGKDPFSSAPGSRVLSPIRPLTPAVESLGSPAPFSLPARLVSTHFLKTSLAKFSSHGVQSHDVFSSYRRSSLCSSKSSNNNEEISRNEAKWDYSKARPGVDKESNRTNASYGNNQFHFSIYKWASKGVPLAMSLHRGSTRFKEKSDKLDESFSSNGRVGTDTMAGEIQPENVTVDDYFSDNVTLVSAPLDTIESDPIIKQCVSDAPISRPNDNVQDGGDNIIHNPLSSLQHGVEGQKGNENVTDKVGGKQSPEKTKVKPSLDVDTALCGSEVEKSKLKGLIRIPKENTECNENRRKVKEKMGSDGAKEKFKENIGSNIEAKGKVKEFVKIFNQECSSKPNLDGSVRGQSNTRSKRNASKAAHGTTASLSMKHGSTQASDVTRGFDSSSMVDGNHLSSGGIQFDVTCVNETHHSSMQMDNFASANGLVPDHTKVLSTNNVVIDESILIKELQEIDERSAKGNEDHQYIQVSESKVLQWSKGKEGNIRSLLSTLQYVLWPNSGWKPIPLVDIIEASSVKRAYQRALLWLHPDKLQQKGAASHEKYIAAKVFDILQEAWDHFNSLGSL